MSYGAYFATQPSTRTYIDTSQPLNGFGAAEGDNGLLAIYDGVAGFGAAPSSGCGCAGGTRGRLSGFGDEVLPDGTNTSTPGGLTVGVTQGTNIQTALVALLVVGTVAAVGYFLLGGSKGGSAMRANGRKRRMRRNGSKRRSKEQRAAHASAYPTWKHVGNGEWEATHHGKALGTAWPSGGGFVAMDLYGTRIGPVSTMNEAKRKLLAELGYVKMRRNGAPKYLLSKRGKTTQRQAKAAGHYLAETRWHGGPKKVARWSGKHLAHKRFNTNGKRPRIMSGYGFVLDEMRAPTAWRTATNDSWEIQQVRRPSRPAKFLGARNIDGSRCNVFLLSSGKVIAQQTQYGHASRADGLPAR